VSDKRKEVNAARREAQEAAWGPRPWRCQFNSFAGPIQRAYDDVFCFGEVNGHEILSRARSGQSDANLIDVSGQVPLCNFHNEWCESNPTLAHEMGLARHAWERDED